MISAILLDDFFDRVDAFMNSDQNRAASKLLSAYTDGDVEEIKRVAQSNIISNLDHVVSLLILSDPSDVAALWHCNLRVNWEKRTFNCYVNHKSSQVSYSNIASLYKSDLYWYLVTEASTAAA